MFFESASAVDSKRTGGLYDVFPWVDKISEAGVLFTNMFANGATSEMGHIATLMGVEPTFLNQNFITLLKSNATQKTAATPKKNPTIYNPTTLFIVENIQLTNEKENLC